MSKGWVRESQRHSLASKGIKTKGTFGARGVETEGISVPVIDGYGQTFKLPIEQIVYVPSTTFNNEPISSEEFSRRIEEVKSFLFNLFGGYTAVVGEGGFRSKTGDVVDESVVRVISYTDREGYENHQKHLFEFLKEKQKEWGQESMGYEVEGDLFYLGETE